MAEVRAAGDFGALYFKENENGELTTSLQAGMLVCMSQNRYFVIVSVEQIEKNLRIFIFSFSENTIFIFKPLAKMHIRTSRRQIDTIKGNFQIQIGDRILAIGMYLLNRLSLDESCGTVREIFIYNEVNRYMLLVDTPVGLRVFQVSQIQYAVQMHMEEDPLALAEQLMSVGIGTRVAEGIVVAVLHFGAISILPQYLIRTPSGKIISRRFDSKVLPIDEATKYPNALREYHALRRQTDDREEFVHDGIRLRPISQNIVYIVKGQRHKMNARTSNATANMIFGYFEFSDDVSWSDYGFISE